MEVFDQSMWMMLSTSGGVVLAHVRVSGTLHQMQLLEIVFPCKNSIFTQIKELNE